MLRLHPSTVDYVILAIYFVVVLGIGFVARLSIKTDLDFFLSGRSLPGLDHRPGLHRRQPRRAGDPRAGRQRRPVRDPGGALLLARRGARDGLPGHRDDAVLLRGQGQVGPGVPAPALQRGHACLQRRHLRRGHGAHLRRQPVRAGADHPSDARLVDRVRDPRRGRAGARLHHARRPHLSDLQRGAAVLHHRRRAAAADPRRAALDRRLERPGEQGARVQEARRAGPARLARAGHPSRDQPTGVGLGGDRVRARVRAQLRLLDDELRRGAARAVGDQHLRRPAHAADRRLPEDLPARDHHRPGDHRRAHRQGSGRDEHRTSPTTPRSRT